MPDEPNSSYKADENGWIIDKEINLNTERIFTVGLGYECDGHYPFRIIKEYLLPRAFNIFLENVCSAIDALTKQFAEWNEEWTRTYTQTVEEWK